MIIYADENFRGQCEHFTKSIGGVRGKMTFLKKDFSFF